MEIYENKQKKKKKKRKKKKKTQEQKIELCFKNSSKLFKKTFQRSCLVDIYK